MAIRLEAIASRLEAIALRLEAIAGKLEAIASRLEAIASRLEAIAHSIGDNGYTTKGSAVFRMVHGRVCASMCCETTRRELFWDRAGRTKPKIRRAQGWRGWSCVRTHHRLTLTHVAGR